jgi:adenosine deaminase
MSLPPDRRPAATAGGERSEPADIFDQAPKVELHLHMEGALPRDTLWDLVGKYGGDPAVPTPDSLVTRLRYTSFANFIDAWVWMTGFVRSYEDFEHIASGVAAALARQHITYAEASFSPTDFAHHGMTPQGIAVALRRGLDRVGETTVVLNCDLVRDTGAQRAMGTLEAVAEVMADADIRGITIGGSESTYPPELFADVYRRASHLGLRLTAHAGEAAGPASVRGALDALRVERIGHGVRAVEDPALLDRIIAEQIPLEVCPTSNILTGVVADWDHHPVAALLREGANVTVNTDDPMFFHTSMAAELRTVFDRYGADPRTLTERAIAASWMTDTEKTAVTTMVADWWKDHRIGVTG